jgi:hypothetical protein
MSAKEVSLDDNFAHLEGDVAAVAHHLRKPPVRTVLRG